MSAKRAADTDDDVAPTSADGPFERRLKAYATLLNALSSEHAKVALPVATIAIAGITGVVLGPPTAVLVLAGGALIGVIATFWASVRTLIGETPLAGADAYALGAPRAEEEQKRAVLRALKDLEFEKSVGKISDEDYQVLVAKYRTEAKRLLKLLDSESRPRRDQVEALVAKRLKREGLATGEKKVELEAAPKPEAESAPEPEVESVPKLEAEAEAEAEAESDRDQAAKIAARSVELSSRPAPLRARKPRGEGAAQLVCKGCGARNDEDAVFCKKCGKKCGSADDTAPAVAEKVAGDEKIATVAKPAGNADPADDEEDA